jgi:hypothetical protein
VSALRISQLLKRVLRRNDGGKVHFKEETVIAVSCATFLQTNENQNTKTREPRQDDAWPRNDTPCPP